MRPHDSPCLTAKRHASYVQSPYGGIGVWEPVFGDFKQSSSLIRMGGGIRGPKASISLDRMMHIQEPVFGDFEHDDSLVKGSCQMFMDSKFFKTEDQ